MIAILGASVKRLLSAAFECLENFCAISSFSRRLICVPALSSSLRASLMLVPFRAFDDYVPAASYCVLLA